MILGASINVRTFAFSMAQTSNVLLRGFLKCRQNPFDVVRVPELDVCGVNDRNVSERAPYYLLLFYFFLGKRKKIELMNECFVLNKS
ncbi:unnamed protein product [Caenorhabditis sp. 36 PRJEB53466]|nr:unnamed protein product [Caenorhabditis sp. 36 PRJEB53466]